MNDQFQRTELLLGRAAMERLARARVAVFGIGGVGGYVCEALVRSGVGAFDLVDSDKVSLTNLNRQIIATHKTVGRYKVDVMKERMLEINPDVDVTVRNCFFLPENADEFPFDSYDYVVDAVDTVTAKVELILRANSFGVPVISAMGAGNKLDPGRFQVADIYQTKVCPLARVMRHEMKKRGIKKLKVVYSDEQPVIPAAYADPDGRQAVYTGPDGLQATGQGLQEELPPGKQRIPGSTAFVPAAAGLMIAGEVIRDLIRDPATS